MVTFLKNLLVILFLVGVVISVTIYSDTIKSFILQKLQTSGAKVLGANTQEISQFSLSKEVGKEANSMIQNVQRQVMQIKIGDIVNSFSQTQKIIHDASGLQSIVRDQLQKLAK